MKRVLVPLDGSALAEAALPALLRLFPADKLDILLFEVLPSPTANAVYPSWGPVGEWGEVLPNPEEARAQAQAYLSQVALRLSGAHVSTTVTEGAPGHAILETIRTAKPDLVAMATHGRGGLARAVMGSVTDLVLRAAAVPVLVVHPLSGAPETPS